MSGILGRRTKNSHLIEHPEDTLYVSIGIVIQGARHKSELQGAYGVSTYRLSGASIRQALISI